MTNYFKRNLDSPESRRIYRNSLQEGRKKKIEKAKRALAGGLVGLTLAGAVLGGFRIINKYNCQKAGNYTLETRAAYEAKKSEDKINEMPVLNSINANSEMIEKNAKSLASSKGSIESIVLKINSEIPQARLENYIKNRKLIHMDESYLPILQKFSGKIDLAMLASIIEAESTWNPECESGCGAYGLMQITKNSATPYEWKNRKNIEVNISAGIRIWKEKEDALKFCEPPEWLKSYDPGRYDTLRWEHFKMIAAAYNGGQSVVRNAVRMAAKKNGKEPWQQKWEDVKPYIESACQPYYDNPKSKAEEILGYVKKVSTYYTLYSVEFQLRRIAGNDAKIDEIIKRVEEKARE
jgi:soluble lytic murein transglycosylase-like protein